MPLIVGVREEGFVLFRCEDRIRKLVFENNVGCERSVHWEEGVVKYLSLFEKMKSQRKG